MSTCTIASSVFMQIDSINKYIEQKSGFAKTKELTKALFELCDVLALFPQSGRQISEHPEIRRSPLPYPFRDLMAYFVVLDDGNTVITNIRHSKCRSPELELLIA